MSKTRRKKQPTKQVLALPYLEQSKAAVLNSLTSLALLSLRVDYHAEAIAMVFFGFSALLKGYLVSRSTFLPRILGVLSAVGGLGWLTYLYEPVASRMAGYIVSFAVVAGFSNALWLLMFAVNEQRWRDQAKAAGQ